MHQNNQNGAARGEFPDLPPLLCSTHCLQYAAQTLLHRDGATHTAPRCSGYKAVNVNIRVLTPQKQCPPWWSDAYQGVLAAWAPIVLPTKSCGGGPPLQDSVRQLARREREELLAARGARDACYSSLPPRRVAITLLLDGPDECPDTETNTKLVDALACLFCAAGPADEPLIRAVRATVLAGERDVAAFWDEVGGECHPAAAERAATALCLRWVAEDGSVYCATAEAPKRPAARAGKGASGASGASKPLLQTLAASMHQAVSVLAERCGVSMPGVWYDAAAITRPASCDEAGVAEGSFLRAQARAAERLHHFVAPQADISELARSTDDPLGLATPNLYVRVQCKAHVPDPASREFHGILLVRDSQRMAANEYLKRHTGTLTLPPNESTQWAPQLFLAAVQTERKSLGALATAFGAFSAPQSEPCDDESSARAARAARAAQHPVAVARAWLHPVETTMLSAFHLWPCSAASIVPGDRAADGGPVRGMLAAYQHLFSNRTNDILKRLHSPLSDDADDARLGQRGDGASDLGTQDGVALGAACAFGITGASVGALLAHALAVCHHEHEHEHEHERSADQGPAPSGAGGPLVELLKAASTSTCSALGPAASPSQLFEECASALRWRDSAPSTEALQAEVERLKRECAGLHALWVGSAAPPAPAPASAPCDLIDQEAVELIVSESALKPLIEPPDNSAYLSRVVRCDGRIDRSLSKFRKAKVNAWVERAIAFLDRGTCKYSSGSTESAQRRMGAVFSQPAKKWHGACVRALEAALIALCSDPTTGKAGAGGTAAADGRMFFVLLAQNAKADASKKYRVRRVGVDGACKPSSAGELLKFAARGKARLAVLYVSAAPVEGKPGEPSNTSQSCGIGVFA